MFDGKECMHACIYICSGILHTHNAHNTHARLFIISSCLHIFFITTITIYYTRMYIYIFIVYLCIIYSSKQLTGTYGPFFFIPVSSLLCIVALASHLDIVERGHCRCCFCHHRCCRIHRRVDVPQTCLLLYV